MLTREDDVEAYALRKRGWSICDRPATSGATARQSAGT